MIRSWNDCLSLSNDLKCAIILYSLRVCNITREVRAALDSVWRSNSHLRELKLWENHLKYKAKDCSSLKSCTGTAEYCIYYDFHWKDNDVMVCRYLVYAAYCNSIAQDICFNLWLIKVLLIKYYIILMVNFHFKTVIYFWLCLIVYMQYIVHA